MSEYELGIKTLKNYNSFYDTWLWKNEYVHVYIKIYILMLYIYTPYLLENNEFFIGEVK